MQLPAEAEAEVSTDVAATDDPDAVRQAREALSRGRSYPWYDASNDSLHRIELPVQKSKSSQSPTANPKSAPPADGLQLLAWILIALVLAAVAALLILAFLRKENGLVGVAPAKSSELSDVDRVEALPFMAQRSPSDLLGQARAHYEAGNYREAIIYLFSHELVELDKQGLIRLTRGKTNRQYLREVASIDELRQILQRTMIAFEDVFFGNKDLTRVAFEECWRELDVFERRMMEAVA
jgi:hypothetical protein